MPGKVNADDREMNGKILKDRRKAVDREFQAMTCDKEYQVEALQITEEFSASDAETIEIAERDMSKP